MQLRSGQLTPAAVRSIIAQLQAELDDAKFFQYPAERISGIEAEIKEFEEALGPGTQAFEEGAKQRADVYAAEIYKAGEAGRFDQPAPVDSARSELNRLNMRLGALQTDLREAIRFRDPEPEIDRLRSKIQETRRSIQDLSDAVGRVHAAPGETKASNPAKPPRRRFAEVAERDLSAGKLTRRDVVRRLARFKRLLEETLEVDPKANKKIALLEERVDHLQSLLRQQGERKAV